jgi:hypothetical protein
VLCIVVSVVYCCECCVLLCSHKIVIFVTNTGAEYSKGNNLFAILYFEKGVVLVFRNLYVFVHGQKCYFFIAKMGAKYSSETLINIYQTARKNIPEDSYLQY